MGKLISIVGNSGSGKTTLTRLLCQSGGYKAYLEGHTERPFQALFSGDLIHFALANQIDYLLFRAEQEWEIRNGEETGIVDGGLDPDFFVFTHLFHIKGYLNEEEFGLCERLYNHMRKLLPPPDLIIHLKASLEILTQRKSGRDRELDISTIEDLAQMENLLEKWLSNQDHQPIYQINTSHEGPQFSRTIHDLAMKIKKL